MLKRCELIKSRDVRYDQEQAVIIVDNNVLRFSPSEYKIIDLLLANEKVHDNTLALALYQREADHFDKRSIKKHVYNMRSRLKPHGLTISRVYNHGYTLHLIEESST